ncbi:hypothetical protein ACFX5U_16815 [Sphingobacterium sp. SG20118]|nr:MULTISPECIES: hypothetical protein [Sphingobacterium]MDH5825599.1 hypothetical protein [Sphingobacterium faecium]
MYRSILLAVVTFVLEVEGSEKGINIAKADFEINYYVNAYRCCGST